METDALSKDQRVLQLQSHFEYELIARSVDIEVPNKHGRENFPQGCAFSPDGLCVLTTTVGDSKLRLYNTPSSLFSIGSNKTDTNNDDDNKQSINDPNDKKLTDDTSNKNSTTNYESDETKIEKWKAALTASGGDSVRSYAWYPHMSSSDPLSCCFAAVARDQPVHLYDAYTGAVRASYSPYNALDEMESPTVVTFSPNGQKIVTGGFRTDRTIFCFDISRPGREAIATFKLGKTRRSSDGQKGFISSMDFQKPNSSSSGNRIFAVGTYSPGSIYVYDDRIMSTTQQPIGTILTGACIVGHGKSFFRKKRRFVSLVESESKSSQSNDRDEMDDWLSVAKAQWFQKKTSNGVLQLSFAPNNEYFLYSSSRRANTVLAWDLRMLSGIDDYSTTPVLVVQSYDTDNDTNQRIEFDFDRETGNTLYVGGRDCSVRVYDTSTGQMKGQITGFDDAVNGVSFFRGFTPNSPILATTSGSRFFPPVTAESDTEVDTEAIQPRPGSVSLFSLKYFS